MEIRNSVALVTGANRGIGRALVEELLTRDVTRVYAAVRNIDSVSDLVRHDARVKALRLDITNPQDIRDAAAVAGDVSLLINNAGVLTPGGPADVSIAAMRENMETNYFGMLNVINAFIPALERNRGSIVNMLTLVALASMPVLSAYNASKAAGLSLTQSYRADLAKRGITVHGVFPGAVDTDMIRAFEMPKATVEGVARAVVEGIENGLEDIFPDAMAEQVYAAWRQDHKAVERQFAAM